jgi:hypothetical protein
MPIKAGDYEFQAGKPCSNQGEMQADKSNIFALCVD